MGAEEAAAWAAWFQSARSNLAEFIRVLEDDIVSSDKQSDSSESFKEVNALAMLAHKAGYREGSRNAIRLLTSKKA